MVVWASIWFAMTAGEGGRGTERAKERARLGVLVRAEEEASSSLCRRRKRCVSVLVLFGIVVKGCDAREKVRCRSGFGLTLLPTPHAP